MHDEKKAFPHAPLLDTCSIIAESFINQKLCIPNYPQDLKTSESLNISVATAIVCSEFRRRMF